MIALLLSVLLIGLSIVILNFAVISKTEARIVAAPALVDGAEPFDCIMVLGCGVRADGTMSDRLRDRVEVGISLWAQGRHRFC